MRAQASLRPRRKRPKREMKNGGGMEQCVITGLLAIPSVRGKKDAIVSKFCGLSCGELIHEVQFNASLTSKILSKEFFFPDFNS